MRVRKTRIRPGRIIMSSDKYIKVAETMNDKQKNIMWNLFMSGKNFDDGRSWVTFQDAEDAVAEILMAERGITE